MRDDWNQDSDVDRFGLEVAETTNTIQRSSRMSLCPQNLKSAIKPIPITPGCCSGSFRPTVSTGGRHGPRNDMSTLRDDGQQALTSKRPRLSDLRDDGQQALTSKRPRVSDPLPRISKVADSATVVKASRNNKDIKVVSIIKPVGKNYIRQRSEPVELRRKSKEGDRNDPICIQDDSEGDGEECSADEESLTAVCEQSPNCKEGPLLVEWRAQATQEVFGSAGPEVPFWEMYMTSLNNTGEPTVVSYLTKCTVPKSAPSNLFIQRPLQCLKFIAYDWNSTSLKAFSTPATRTVNFNDIRSIR